MTQLGAKRQRLVCDHCHHQETVDRLHKGLIGKECPVCQSNMLTAADYRLARRTMRKLAVLTLLSRLLVRIFPKAKVRTGVLSVQVRDGDIISDFREGGIL